jgi:hypothetical protein
VAINNLVLRIFKRVSADCFSEVYKVRVLYVGLVIFHVVLIAQLDFIHCFVLLHHVLTSTCTHQIFLISVVLLDLNLLVGVRHQLLRNLVIVNYFTRIGLAVLRL